MARQERCRFWLPRKARFCSASALSNLGYCGNHKPLGVETRIPCPVDPSHTILQGEVQAHSRKCPGLRHSQQLESMEYHAKGANAGSDDEDNEICNLSFHPVTEKAPEDAIGQVDHDSFEQQPSEGMHSHGTELSSKMKRTILNSLCREDFVELVRKIEASYQLHCVGKFEESCAHPSACNKWINAEIGREIPFQEKHVLQQASLIGNMERFGLVQVPCTPKRCAGEPVYVEFGAGRGYLAHMLADCYEVGNVVLVERKAYKFKADRTLRQNAAVSFERLRIDIEDLDLRGVKRLQGRKFIALSKHLCGSATDFALRCCILKSKQSSSKDFLDSSHKEILQPAKSSAPLLDGLAIATCCHHRCQWRPYVNKNFFISLGFTKKDFIIITWLTSWALSGDHGIDMNKDVSMGRSKSCLPSLTASMEVKDIDGRKDSDGLEVLRRWVTQPDDRSTLGLRCKHLLDVGRLYWLRDHGSDAKLVNYVLPSVSPENKLLLAKGFHN